MYVILKGYQVAANRNWSTAIGLINGLEEKKNLIFI